MEYFATAQVSYSVWLFYMNRSTCSVQQTNDPLI